MKKIRGIVSEIKQNMQTFDDRLFWTICPLVVVAGLSSVIGTIVEGFGTVAIISGLLCVLCPIVIGFINYKINDSVRCFTALSLVLTCILMPVTFLTNGGLRSGMPVYCMAAIMMCTFCTGRKRRLVVFVISMIVTLTVFYLSKIYSQYVYAISENFIDNDIWLSFLVSGVGLYIITSAVVDEFHDYAGLQKILSSHMDRNVRDYLLKSKISDVDKIPTKSTNVAVMFMDISGFTKVSESFNPEMLENYLNTFFTAAENAVFRNGGIVDKYIGDEVMAFWEDTDGQAVMHACTAAIQVREQLQQDAEKIYNEFGNEMRFSTGINYGTVLMADVGSSHRRDFTVIGDAVNTASRLEAAAPAGTIYLSTEAAEKVNGMIEIVPVPKKVMLKGKSNPVIIYTVIGFSKNGEKTELVKPIKSSGFILYFLGVRGSNSVSGARFNEFGGDTSCYVLKRKDYAIVVDCGSGLNLARSILADCNKIDILLTHVHYDHLIGLLDWSLFPANAELTIYGNFSKWHGKETLHRFLSTPYWPVDMSRGEIVEINVGEQYRFADDVAATFYPADHPNEACTIAMHLGEKRICFMVDCETPKGMPEYEVKNCDLLVFDGMYEDRFYSEHIGWGHSTWESGVRYAEEMQVQRLILSHHSPRNSDEKLRGIELQAQEMLPGTLLARSGDRYIL